MMPTERGEKAVKREKLRRRRSRRRRKRVEEYEFDLEKDGLEIVEMNTVHAVEVYNEPDPFLTRAGPLTSSRKRARSASECSMFSHGSQPYWDHTKDLDEPIKWYAIHGDGVTPVAGLGLLSTDMPVASGSTLGIEGGLNTSTATIPAGPSHKRRKITTDSDNPFYSEPVQNVAAAVPPAITDHYNPNQIAYAPHLQKWMDCRKLSIGVQWEIARLASLDRIKLDDVSFAALDKLMGTNSEAAPKVAGVLLPDALPDEPQAAQFVAAIKDEMRAKTPWPELDKEVESLKACQTAGLGCNGDDPWYGGKVHFIGKVKDNGSGRGQKARFTIELERPTLGPSSRFARRFGSQSILRISIPKTLLREKGMVDDITAYFRRPFVLHSRVFRVYLIKDTTAFLYMTNECFELGKIILPLQVSQNGQMSLLEFLNWHNPLEYNSNQTVVKWAARFALGLSNSVPGIKLDPSCIHKIEDVASPSWNGKGKLPSKHDMTDGCGFGNAPFFRHLREKFQWEPFLTALQCRLGGAKGMKLLHPAGRFEDTQDPPTVWVRPSQTKINYAEDEQPDDAMLIVDVIRLSKMKTPAKLSAETIICLAENGVNHETFVQLMTDGLDEIVRDLTTWDGPNAMQRLFWNIGRVGGVMSARMARELGGESRAMGFREFEDDKDEDEDEEDGLQIDLAVQQRSTAWWDDQISGQPSSLHETGMTLVASGFHPATCPVLAAKLKEVLRMAIASYVKRYKINIVMSCTAHIVPDPSGQLEPGEIYIKTQGLGAGFIGQDGVPTDTITGDVLVMRHPCKLPSDIQKVKAIDCPALRQFHNVVIFSTKGDSSLASKLSGGDYDGDIVNAIWQPEIVNQFNNADDSFATPPEGFEDCLVRNMETVNDILMRIPPNVDPDLLVCELQTFILAPLKNQSVVGKYSVMHDNAVYERGYFSEEAKMLAYKFCASLDGIKSGVTVDPKVYKKDLAEFSKGLEPPWKAKEESPYEDYTMYPIKRLKDLEAFIMDTIKATGEAKFKEHMSKYEKLIGTAAGGKYDEDLAAVYLEAKRRAEIVKEKGCSGKMEELECIIEHVKRVRVRHRDSLRGKSGSPNKMARKGAGFTNLKIETRQDTLRALSKEFASEPTGLIFFEDFEVERIRASYAYYHDWEETKWFREKWTRFPWDVATRELCAIKAKAVGFEKTITRDFYEKMNVVSSVRV